MKIVDWILVLSGGGALYLGYQWYRAQAMQARAIRVNAPMFNPASPYAAPGHPVLNPPQAANVADRYPDFAVTAHPPGFVWNEAAQMYMLRDSENVLEFRYA